MLKIIPVILTNNPQELKDMMRASDEVTDMVQVDVVDGAFAPNKTVDPDALQLVETNLNIDFHLMTKEPVNWVERCARGQAYRITGNIEMMESQVEFVEKVVGVGCKVGLALNLETPVEAIDTTVLNDLDAVLLLSIKKVGFGGQSFDEVVFEKIEKLIELRKGDTSPFNICVDGGITKEVLKRLNSLGVDEAFVGRRLFEGSLGENINSFESLANT